MTDETTRQAPVVREGWTYLYNSPKWHYFSSDRDNRSLCNRYMLLVMPDELEQGNEESSSNCKACVKALKRRQQKAG
jgi:hypothetical protein